MSAEHGGWRWHTIARPAVAAVLAVLAIGCVDDDSPGEGGPDAAVPVDAAEPHADHDDAELADAHAPEDVLAAMRELPMLVTTKSGAVQGQVVEEARQFLGIPYARPPVGALRFMPPQPVEPWSEPHSALAFGPACPQLASPLGAKGPQSEDCLTLNVFTPTRAHERLPVMIWIHGGAFIAGGSSQYEVGAFAQRSNVVVVTLNYRLNVFGFLAHPALDGVRGGTPSGNDGLRDQQLAIRWIRDNIEAFGGDPDNITLFGESAGAMSACVHMVSPTSRELVQRHILQSGSCLGGLSLKPKEALDVIGGELVANRCADGDVVECLRALPVDALLEWSSSRDFMSGSFSPSFHPDDPLLPKPPAELLRERPAQSPLLLGTNVNEWGLFAALLPPVTNLATLDAAIARHFPGALGAAVRVQYPASDATAGETYVRILTDVTFRCPTRKLARVAAEAGAPVFLYSFAEGPAFHAFEIPYLFDTRSTFSSGAGHEPLHTRMRSYWTQFARAGTPNDSVQPAWPRYELASDRHLTLRATPEAADSLAKHDCDFWASIGL